jgi:hypothetical protein
MSSASSARSAANVSITSSSLMSVTCAEFCRHTLSITTEAARISRWTRIALSLAPYSRPPPAPLSPSHSSAVCTIATSVEQPELVAVTEPAPLSRCCRHRGLQLPRSDASALGVHATSPLRQRAALYSNSRKPSAKVFNAKPIPGADEFLSKDRFLSAPIGTPLRSQITKINQRPMTISAGVPVRR